MESLNENGVPVGEVGASIAESSAGVAPLTNSILSQAVLNAIGHTDAKLAFDMMLVNEHLTTQDAANRALKEEVAFLKQTLAKQTQEQSEMFHYFHDKTDEHMARILELEKALSESLEAREVLAAASRESLENEQRERCIEQEKALGEVAALKEELRQVHAFAEAKREMEAHTKTLEMKLDAQRAAFQTQVQDLERNNLLEQARTKQELLGRMQAAKAELMLRTNDQVASTTHRTLLENEHFTQELAFQSRETEKLLERLDAAQHEVAVLRAKNTVLEANEQLMARKNRYYQKILARLQQTKPADGDSTIQLQINSSNDNGENNGDERAQKASSSIPELDNSNVMANIDEEKDKRREIQAQLQRALEWLRLFQRERQFMLSQQDEVIQFLYHSLDEATEAQRRRSEAGLKDTVPANSDLKAGPISSDLSKRAEDLIQLAPSITSMEAFGRRMLVPRPALDELSSADAHDVLLFLLEKLRLYQVKIATVYPNSYLSSSPTSPVKQMLERQLGVELPPIVSPSTTSPSPSSFKQKRRIFAHVTAAVEAGNMEWLGSPKTKVAPAPQITQAPVSPQLLAMATNQFNFVGQSPKHNSPTKRRYQQLHHSSFGKNPAVSPPRKTQIQVQPLIPWSKDEVLSPWPGTASTASISEWDPASDSAT
ncbi:unnamed protein product [Phytophthora lilii]|uniref:Cilia- and flagella-associated protein 157 n=1 Tax=Phytophthora lilii TaxID=2077276 RepID=A0A9W6X3K6_9STRA|nr:unnamed protein product [Phytophthora lilii]